MTIVRAVFIPRLTFDPWMRRETGVFYCLDRQRETPAKTKFTCYRSRMRRKPAWLYQQAAAIPYRIVGSDVEILLITSRSGKRWIVPKGVIEKGESAQAAAAREAEEEAGVRGVVHPESVRTYAFTKWGRTGTATIFLLQVRELLADWPETRERKRQWFSLANVADVIHEPELKQIIQAAGSERLARRNA